ncbi:DUF86 domain-containing protein [Candidatus Pacearchaeota archaeon]|nr:DUF86 domain-containing protein [Candidatus Pacearchaeota archaeon]
MKDDLTLIKHILDNINKIEKFSKDLKKEDLSKDELKQYALIRAIELIGEAAKNITKNMKEKHNEVPWKDIIGSRDRIIHQYFGINLEIIWNIIKKDIPKLKVNLDKILKELESKN